MMTQAFNRHKSIKHEPAPESSAHADLISVVMPNFNGRETIERAVSSVLLQDHTQIQLIVIDDCSTDDSVAFLKQKFSDPRITIKQLDKKCMIGYARNIGISLAEGEYIFFLDSDDFLLPGALSTLLAIAKKSCADITQGGIEYLAADGKISAFHQSDFTSNGGIDGLMHFGATDFASIAWNKLYHRALFDTETGIRFMEHYMHEDVPFSMECAFKARRIISTPHPVICYTENISSVTRKKPTRLNVESYVALYIRLSDLCQSFDLHSNKTGMQLARNILKAHGCGDIITKLIRCREQMGQTEFEETLSDVGYSMAGRYGMAAASLIGGLTTLLYDAQKPKDPFRSIKRFIKKRYNRAP